MKTFPVKTSDGYTITATAFGEQNATNKRT